MIKNVFSSKKCIFQIAVRTLSDHHGCEVRIGCDLLHQWIVSFTELFLFQDIGVLLLEVVCQDTDLWVVAEALDSIFDVFGEDHIDPVLKEIGLVDKLKTVAPALKSKVS